MAKLTPIAACRMCTSSDLHEVMPLTPTPAGDHYLRNLQEAKGLECFPLILKQCGVCGHVQLASMVDPEYIYSDYIYTTSSSLGLAEHFSSYASMVSQSLNLSKDSFVVEIGSNDGTMLKAFQQQGHRVLGVDPATDIANKATLAGQKTLNAFFTSALAKTILAKYGEADLFIANNVLANVPDPYEIFLGASQLLGPQGVIIFETGYLKYLAEDCVFDNIYHEHIDYYSIRPLMTLLERLGLVLFDVHVSESKGSSIRCMIQKATGNRVINQGIETLLKREKVRSYGSSQPYLHLDQRLQNIKKALLRELSGFKKEGKVIAGFGASVGVTTMLYYFGLNDFIDYLVDDNTSRHGLFSPGLGLEVKDSKILHTQEKPDVVVILAWRYAKPILSKHLNYINNGGFFIKVLPEFSNV